MSIRLIVTRGFGNGVFNGSVADIARRGFAALSNVNSSHTTSWDVDGIATTPVNSSHTTSWNARSNVNSSQSTSWNMLNNVNQPHSTSWDVLNNVNSSHTTSWNIGSSTTPVNSSHFTSWNSGGAVNNSHLTSWSILPIPGATRSACRTFVMCDSAIDRKLKFKTCH